MQHMALAYTVSTTCWVQEKIYQNGILASVVLMDCL